MGLRDGINKKGKKSYAELEADYNNLNDEYINFKSSAENEIQKERSHGDKLKKQFEKEIEGLMKQFDRTKEMLNNRIGDNEAEIDRLRKSNERLKHIEDALENKDEITDLIKGHSIKEKDLIAREKALSDAKAKHDKNVKAFEEKLNNLKESHKKIQNSKTLLSQNETQYHENLANLKKAQDDLSQKEIEYNVNLANLEKAQEKLSQNEAQYETERKAFVGALKIQSEKETKYNENLAILMRAQDDLSQKETEYNENLANLEKAQEKLSQNEAQYETERKALVRALKIQSEKETKYNENLAALEKAQDALSQKETQHSKDLAALEKAQDALSQKETQYSKDLVALEKVREALSEKEAQYHKDIAGLKKAQDALSQKEIKYTKNLSELNKKENDFNKQKQEFDDNKNEWLELLEELEKTQGTLELEIDDLTKKMDTIKGSFHTLQNNEKVLSMIKELDDIYKHYPYGLTMNYISKLNPDLFNLASTLEVARASELVNKKRFLGDFLFAIIIIIVSEISGNLDKLIKLKNIGNVDIPDTTNLLEITNEIIQEVSKILGTPNYRTVIISSDYKPIDDNKLIECYNQFRSGFLTIVNTGEMIIPRNQKPRTMIENDVLTLSNEAMRTKILVEDKYSDRDIIYAEYLNFTIVSYVRELVKGGS